MNDTSSRSLVYKPLHKVRFVTAASLFDGHDASINIMRRILQASGCEVIHLGHNRSVEEIVNCALQEDAHGIAISSYQGGHVEFFKYMLDLLRERGAPNVKVFGGGGGVIVAAEIAELHAYGVTRIFSPEDGQQLGLQGMINEIVAACDADLARDLPADVAALVAGDRFARTRALARMITGLEAGTVPAKVREAMLAAAAKAKVPTLGITGTGGAGKSSLTDEIVRRFRLDQHDKLKIAIISIDPSRRKSGGALLGDRIRMNAIEHPNIYMRSLATRDAGSEVSKALPDVIAACKVAGFDLVIVETSGIGQGDAAIVPLVDTSLYVMTPEFGAASQLEKIDMLDFADFVAINKFDRKGAADALRDVRKQYQRNREAFKSAPDEMPVYGTMAARFNDDGVTALYQALLPALAAHGLKLTPGTLPAVATRFSTGQHAIVPAARVRYLAEIAEAVRGYHGWAKAQSQIRPRAAAAPRVEGDAGRGRRLQQAAEREGRRRRHRICAAAQGNRRGRPARARRAGRRAREAARPACAEAARHVAEDPGRVRRRRIRGQDPRQGDPHRAHHRIAVGHARSEGGAAALRGRRRDPALAAHRERSRLVSVHRRRVRVQARERGPDADVRRRGRRLPHQQALPPARRQHAGEAAVHRVRLGDALRQRPRDPPRHLRQGRQFRRVDRHARRSQGALLGLRPLRAQQLGVDDDQRPRADDSRDVHEHRDRPAARQVPRRQRPRADRRRDAEDPRMDAGQRARHGPGRHPQGGPGAEHLHLLDRVQPQGDGRHPGIFRHERRQEFLLGVDLGLPHRRGGGEPDQPARLHAVERLHVRRGLSRARHAHRRLRAEPVVLLLLWHGPRVRGDRPGRAADLGGGDARALRRERAQPEAQVPLADLGAQPARAGDRVQRHPHDAAGADLDLRQHQQPAHQRLRRGDHHAHGGQRAPRDGDPAHHQPRVGPRQEREPEPGRVRHRAADRPRRGSGAEGVRGDLRARRRAGRDGDRLPARQDPGRVALLRAQEARRLVSDRRRQHVPQPARRPDAEDDRARALDRRREAVAALTPRRIPQATREGGRRRRWRSSSRR